MHFDGFNDLSTPPSDLHSCIDYLIKKKPLSYYLNPQRCLKNLVEYTEIMSEDLLR